MFVHFKRNKDDTINLELRSVNLEGARDIISRLQACIEDWEKRKTFDDADGG